MRDANTNALRMSAKRIFFGQTDDRMVLILAEVIAEWLRGHADDDAAVLWERMAAETRHQLADASEDQDA